MRDLNENGDRLQVLLTKDGSTTLYSEHLDETYHSRNGAVQESQFVFIDNGLKRVTTPSINILEVGMGTGLNVVLTLLNQEGRSIHYTALEPYPLHPSILNKLHFPLPDERTSEKFNWLLEKVHRTKLEEIVKGFTLEVLLTALLDFNPIKIYDLVYFDAFAPNKQPELWTEEVFRKIFGLLTPGGLLTTYCAQGEFKRNLKSCGFEVEAIPGPPGKREMTLAYKPD